MSATGNAGHRYVVRVTRGEIFRRNVAQTPERMCPLMAAMVTRTGGFDFQYGLGLRNPMLEVEPTSPCGCMATLSEHRRSGYLLINVHRKHGLPIICRRHPYRVITGKQGPIASPPLGQYHFEGSVLKGSISIYFWFWVFYTIRQISTSPTSL